MSYLQDRIQQQKQQEQIRLNQDRRDEDKRKESEQKRQANYDFVAKIRARVEASREKQMDQRLADRRDLARRDEQQAERQNTDRKKQDAEKARSTASSAFEKKQSESHFDQLARQQRLALDRVAATSPLESPDEYEQARHDAQAARDRVVEQMQVDQDRAERGLDQERSPAYEFERTAEDTKLDELRENMRDAIDRNLDNQTKLDRINQYTDAVEKYKGQDREIQMQSAQMQRDRAEFEKQKAVSELLGSQNLSADRRSQLLQKTEAGERKSEAMRQRIEKLKSGEDVKQSVQHEKRDEVKSNFRERLDALKERTQNKGHSTSVDKEKSGERGQAQERQSSSEISQQQQRQEEQRRQASQTMGM